ncbi:MULTISPECIES: biotin/lipoyl-containing protein, partial [unclassified Winkia]
MSESVKMPALGESITEGTVSRWLKEVGDTVEVDEPIVEVSTDKVDSEVPSPAAGTILKILVPEDETVDVGTEIAIIGDSSEQEEDSSAPDASGQQADAPKSEEKSEGSHADGESTDVKMPALGESITEGTVSRWLKEVGDKIEADEPLVEVSTDKVDSEVPAPVSGYLVEIVVPEDETVDVDTVIARISSSQDAAQSGSTDDIPSSSKKDGDETIVQWAYPQSDGSSSKEVPGTASAEEATDVKMPALGESITEGTVSRWLKEVGD